MSNLIKGKQLADAPFGVSEGKINNATVPGVSGGTVTWQKVDSSVLNALSNLALAPYDAQGRKITNLAPATLASDAVRYDQLTGLVNGLDWKDAVVTATAGALPAYTPAGNVLTAVVNGAITDGSGPGALGGVPVALNQRVLIKNEGVGFKQYNGIYKVTAVGDGSNPWILTRTSDADTSASVTNGMACVVSDPNSSQFGYIWVLITPDPIVLNTTDLQFTNVPLATSYTAGNGITIAGLIISAKLEPYSLGNGGIQFGGGGGLELYVKPNPVTSYTGGLSINALGQLQADFDPAGPISTVGISNLIRLDLAPATAGGGGLQVTATELEVFLDTLKGLGYSPAGLIVKILTDGSDPIFGGLDFDVSGFLGVKAGAGLQISGANDLQIKLKPNSALLASVGGGLLLNTNNVNQNSLVDGTNDAGFIKITTPAGLLSTPLKNNTLRGVVQMYINGVRVTISASGIASANEPAFFAPDGNPGAPIAATAVAAGDVIYVDPALLGYTPDTSDWSELTYLKQT